MHNDTLLALQHSGKTSVNAVSRRDFRTDFRLKLKLQPLTGTFHRDSVNGPATIVAAQARYRGRSQIIKRVQGVRANRPSNPIAGNTGTASSYP